MRIPPRFHVAQGRRAWPRQGSSRAGQGIKAAGTNPGRPNEVQPCRALLTLVPASTEQEQLVSGGGGGGGGGGRRRRILRDFPCLQRLRATNCPSCAQALRVCDYTTQLHHLLRCYSRGLRTYACSKQQRRDMLAHCPRKRLRAAPPRLVQSGRLAAASPCLAANQTKQ